MAAPSSSQVLLSPQYSGLGRLDPNPPGSLELTSELLQKNHERYHMYFRDVAGHNHIPHSLLTVLAMGGGPKELNRAYDDGYTYQRPLAPADGEFAKQLGDEEKFKEHMYTLSEYSNFLAFFEQEIDAKGWKTVFNKYCFDRTPFADNMLSQLYEGLYHPILHLGFGVEFNQPSLIAEGLAHAASHDSSQIGPFFLETEKLAKSGSVKPKPLVELYAEIRANQKIREAAWLKDGPLRGKGIVNRAHDELVKIAAQFQVRPEDLERSTAEMMSCGALTSAAQKAGKARKIDFFYLHIVTCSIFFSALNQQDWLKTEDKVRLLEWKGRLDLVWYAANGSAEMKIENVLEYEPSLSKGWDWRAIYKNSIDIHDDGHVVKFMRALKHAEGMVEPHVEKEGAASFPINGDMWLKIAQICYDSTATIGTDIPGQLSKKWVWGAGFEPPWFQIPNLG
ncbi:HypA [Sclerotinia borealis F-4128]|uniref:HypA n=1 Tax=Sclerotinia borealis (strain F-4128) TaxID=1432307 RepID=W9CSZ1_SCLBF|nr:HypA [Sclerotinia borealis F-4128]